ncbi:MAG: potassium transporter TrkG [bacterium]
MIFSIAKRPALGLVLGFIAAILIGTFMLLLPAATPAGDPISFVDALFTATSATCVTGLIVRSTPLGFTFFGKTVILLLIQLGALGLMTFSIALIITLGKKISKAQEMLLVDALNEDNIRSARKILNFLLIFTFGAEAAGTVLLFFGFRTCFPPGEAFKMALFHSVSAFCNAGFSLFDTSITGFSSNIYILAVVGVLIILGGIGFVVLLDCKNYISRETRRFKLHTKLAVATTLILLLSGTLFFYAAEKNNVLAGMSKNAKWANSIFCSVTARTAGFNSVDTSKIKPFSKFITCALMFIGASPGGTGGGVKTITFAVIFLLVLNHIRSRGDLVIYRRSIPSFLAVRAVAILVYAAVITFTACSIILFVENFPLQNIVFEVVSAFGTVGLSTGITAGLSDTSKQVLTAVMFMGRLGPLTIALAAIGRKERLSISYASERVMLG